MNHQPQVVPQADAGCSVTSTAGTVQVHHPALFGLGSEACSLFAARVFQWAEVSSLEIDGTAATATVRFSTRVCQETALRQLAAALEAGVSEEHLGVLKRILCCHTDDRVRIFRSADNWSTWEVIRHRDDAVVVRHSAARTWHDAHRITAVLAETSGIEGFRWRSLSRSLVVRFDSARLTPGDVLMLLDESLLQVQNDARIQRDYASALPVGGIRRLAFLGLAAGSFGLAVLGVILPGLPTVPFLLVTSYFLVRSSPRLNARLLRSRTFGPMLRDWNEHGAMRPRVKLVAVVLMLLVFAVTVTFASLSIPLLILVTLLILFGILFISRIPTISGAQESAAVASQLPHPVSRSLLATVTT